MVYNAKDFSNFGEDVKIRNLLRISFYIAELQELKLNVQQTRLR